MQRGPRVSLSIKAGLILFAVVAGALAIVYFAVVPQLEERLVNAKIEELESALPGATREVEPGNPFQNVTAADVVAADLGVDVIIFGRLSQQALIPFADSREVNSTDVQDDPVALDTLTQPTVASGRVYSPGRPGCRAPALRLAQRRARQRASRAEEPGRRGHRLARDLLARGLHDRLELHTSHP
jgi:hypothetical protein